MFRIASHPALSLLSRLQMHAQVDRIARNFRGTRRLILSTIAVLIGALWLSQAAIGLLMRQPATTEQLWVWIPASLAAYTGYQLIKALCTKRTQPFDWSNAERDLLLAAPLARSAIIRFRLSAIVRAAILKASCFSLIMINDLGLWLFGLVGMFLGLVFIDLLRMTAELTAYGLSNRAFQITRGAIIGAVIFALVGVILRVLPISEVLQQSSAPPMLAIAKAFFAELLELSTHDGVAWIGLPFKLFTTVILAESFGATTVFAGVGSVSLVAALLVVVIKVDQWALNSNLRQTENDYDRAKKSQSQSKQAHSDLVERWAVPYRMAGIGTLVWRQFLGMVHYRGSVAAALSVPGILSLVTLLAPQPGWQMVAQLVGGLIFYTFVLLPTAMRFDFRRDLDRIALLKTLPMRPISISVGQLVMPVVVVSLFQCLVLSAALLLRPYPVYLLFASLIVLWPLNVVVFAFENLIYLLYPYRHHQEGITVFIRSILTFTAKSLIFTVAAVLALGWLVAANQLGVHLTPEDPVKGPCLVFVAGMVLFNLVLAASLVQFVGWAFRRFDPSCDVPPA